MSARSETAGFMAMKGSGYYSKATVGARDVINAAAPLILAAIDRIPRTTAVALSAAPISAAPTAAPRRRWSISARSRPSACPGSQACSNSIRRGP